LFPPANHVHSKGKKPPPGPCFACGSSHHWNKDCPHWDEYQARRPKEGFSAELDGTGQVAYDTAYALIVEQGFDWATRTSRSEGEAECKSHDEEEGKESEGRVREVLIASVPNFFERIEEIPEEYWHQGECLPADSLYDLEYIYADPDEDSGLAGRGVRAEVYAAEERSNEATARRKEEGNPSEGVWEEEKDRALFFPKPYEPAVIHLKPGRVKNKNGRMATSVLSVRGRVGSKENAVIDLRLDSCANPTLVSGSFYDGLKGPKRIGQGEPMNLMQLTSTETPIRGTTRLEVTIEADDGTPISVMTDMYVVDGMTVDILLGEDFQQAYEISVSRSLENGGRTEVVFAGAKEHPITAFKRIRQHRKKLKEKARLVDSLVRATHEVRLPPHTCVRVKVEGPFEDDQDWIVEKLLLASGEDQVMAVPNTLVSRASPYVPVANPSDSPKIIRKGDVLGRAEKADKFFDKAKTQAEHESFREHATRMALLCSLQSEPVSAG
ncbi:hypothetical protein K525DRAFT_154094, partial [Schizophyllum commune Loenen D]